MDFSCLIEDFLEEMNINYTIVERSDGRYYKCNSPVLPDKIPSFQIFDNGWCNSYNGSIEGKTRIHLKDIMKMTGYIQMYIEYVLNQKNISIYKANKYKELIIKKILKEEYNKKEYRELVNLFNSLYISQSDILMNNGSFNEYVKKETYKKKKVRKSKIVELPLSNEEYQKCFEYIKSRGIKFDDGRIEPVKIKIGEWKTLGIAFRHIDGHNKYRLLNAKMRYISSGKYSHPFIVKKEDNKKVILGEGQIEMESIKFLEGYDIYAIANTNSLGDISLLKNYDECIIFIDNDTIDRVKDSIEKKILNEFSNIKLKILPKFKVKDKKIDFNYALVKKGKDFLEKYLKKVLTK